MRRITMIAVLAAIAILSTAAVASASVAFDGTTATGFVGKGDVQNALGLANDGAMQDLFKAGGVKFTSHYKWATTTNWSCSDGTTNSRTSTVIQAVPMNVTANTNNAGKLTNGWNLDGIKSTFGSYVSGGYSGAAYNGDCGPNAYSTGFLPHGFDNGPLGGLYVNGVELPNTPIVVPAA
jgi:hypothetical protein